ncbi:MAG: cell division protein FtsW [Bdellovibrionales bacterium]|nr:cell division protein FtsW [Bdellovibrionales bacterium]
MRIDRGILLCVFFLMGLGLVQVYSSSYIFATEMHGDGLFFFRKQVLFSLLGISALFTMYLLPWKTSSRIGFALWVVAVLAVIATFIPGIGMRVGGAHRWLNLPFGFRFEPGELLRVTYPFVLAPLISQYAAGNIDGRWLTRLLLALSPLALLNFQPDFGSFVIILTLTASLFVAFGLRWRFILGGVALVVPTLAIMILTSPYRRLRVEAFLNPWADPAEKGFQVIQSMLSFYSGGLTGVGLGQGQGKLFFLPEAHTDFTLAVLGEEMGFLGFFILLMVFGFVVFRGFQIALQLKRVRERATALSFSLLLTFAVFINVGVSMGLLPTKGLTLPLISYGGSSLLCTGLMIGWLLNLQRQSLKPVSFREKEIE